jgi:trehalose synthase-fused probable maltokinase
VERDLWLDTVLPRLLPQHLPGRRWFGGKARTIQSVALEDAVWLADDPRPCALIVASVQYGDAGHERYAMPLAFVDDPADLPVVGRFEGAGPAWVVDAASDRDAMLALMRRLTAPREARSRRGGALRGADASAAALEMLAASSGEPPTVRPVGTEQSNSSVRVDRTLVFKLFRRVSQGENPELEVGRFLTARTAFRATPALHGSLTYISPGGETSTIGVLQNWIDNSGDGWSYVVGALRQRDGAGDLLNRDLAALGAMTAEFHAALASSPSDAAFSPEPVSAADLAAWRDALVGRATRTLGLVEASLHGWSDDARRLGQSLLARQDGSSILARVANRVAALDRFHKIRVHGDYHLGQTLKTPDGFVVIDFEGEPARPLAERRLKSCSLRDVAGMLRSFDYATETARAAQGRQVPATERLSEPFLNSYLSTAAARSAAFLPRNRPAIDAWIDFFELEKALYEVEYEVNNRPDWVHIPLGGVLRILRRSR